MRALVLLLASLSGCVTYERYTINDDDLRRLPPEASMNGKYEGLLVIFDAPEDVERYGRLRDYGWWNHTYYKGEGPLPRGYWVYVEPVWYVWERAVVRDNVPSGVATPPPDPVVTASASCNADASTCCLSDGRIVRPGGCQPDYPSWAEPATRRGPDGWCVRVTCTLK